MIPKTLIGVFGGIKSAVFQVLWFQKLL